MNFSLGRMKKNPTHILALYNQREKQKTLTIQVLFSTYAILVYIMLCVFLAPADKTRTVLYVCCRDGKKIGHFGVNKTGKTRKRVASRKIDTYCTARITATENLVTGKVHVRYLSSHMNHNLGLQECRYLPLPPSVKKEIQE